ncbi:SH3 domain-containing protein [Tabrizicola sp.]|uniref:SH3 domain-containing protein n=1 Tax=Tabrizicola sp. TaxID=2005166 RepID=UPI0027361FCD|nr:SH3 domain-containing protein [Tabrizicola sp.]MDP3196300.1 SH3 domain-containing protein [Tabrizicola sp.]
MRLRYLGFPLFLLATAGVALACGGAPVCTVADPTGTPLNIRLSPNGPVVGSTRNGTKLMFVEHREVDGKLWALVERFHDGELATDFDGAWVFGSYLDCAGTTRALPEVPFANGTATTVACTVADPTGTPLNARADPGGEIFATLRNGTVVRAIAQRSHQGKQWIYVEKWAGDNVVGWVFDDYMACEEDETH